MDAEEMSFDALDEAFDATRRAVSAVRVFNLFSKRAFDYSFLAVGSTNVTIHRALKVPPFYYYWLALRIHNLDITNGTFTLQLFQTLPSGQDPQEFSAATPSMSLACLTADTAPTLKVVTQRDLGPYFKVALNGAQGTASARFYAELSAVLYARPA